MLVPADIESRGIAARGKSLDIVSSLQAASRGVPGEMLQFLLNADELRFHFGSVNVAFREFSDFRSHLFRHIARVKRIRSFDRHIEIVQNVAQSLSGL
jgi:hypothetical protein